MSRFRRAFQNALSSYLALGAATCFSLASVPFALHYLSKELFALWALMTSISGYLNLVDLGMSASVARLLIDHKDDRDRKAYGSLVQTGWLVLLTQGFILFVVCWFLAPWLASLLDISNDLRPDFIGLMRWQGASLAFSFATRLFSHLLYAHQRVDLTNYAQTVSLGLNLFSLWWFFRSGCGIYSLVWAGMVNAGVLAAGMWWGCARLHLFPARGSWGYPAWAQFKDLFSYGKDLFLLAVGSQLILASQTIIITRSLGLVPAALWAVGTKAYNLVLALMWRSSDASSPGFGEMLTRGERDQLLKRYRTVATLCASFAAYCAVAYALCNNPFVTIWTSKRFFWPPINDVLLGACLLVSTLVHCHNGFVALTKQLRFMRYIFFIEGTVFVGVALAVAQVGGFPVIILASLICSLVFSGAYGVYRVARFFQIPVLSVAGEWLLPAWSFVWRYLPIALAAWWATRAVNPLPRFLVHAAVSATIGILLFAKFGIPAELQAELVHRLPPKTGPFLRWIFASAQKAPGAA